MQYLNQPLAVKGFELSNRLVMPPMATSRGDEDGHVTQQILEYYHDKTQGGYIGLVITEHSYVSQEGMANKRQMSVSKDEDIPGLKQLAKTIHTNGSIAVAQISHAGSSSKRSVTGADSVGPSAVDFANRPAPDHQLSVAEIQALVQKFADAARRCVEAGFDGVEIHAAHGYLLNQFYSPLTNNREDEYGGDVFGRIKFHLEVIQAIRKEIGDEALLLLRLGAIDDCEGGNTLEDAMMAAKAFEKAGIDILDISGGMTGIMIRGREKQQGYFSQETERLKREIEIPVLLTGGITDPAAAETLLQKGQADLIGVGRAILKDSQWARRAIDSEAI